ERVELLDFLLVEEGAGVEALHLGRDPARVIRRVEARDRAEAGYARLEARPGLVPGQTDRRHEAHPRDGDTAPPAGVQGRGHVLRDGEKRSPRRLRPAWRETRCRTPRP